MEIGLLLFISVFRPCLKIGQTLACFIAEGTIPVAREELITIESGLASKPNSGTTVHGSISSGPALCVGLREWLKFSLCSCFHAHPTTLLLKILGGPMHGRFPYLKFGGDRLPSPP